MLAHNERESKISYSNYLPAGITAFFMFLSPFSARNNTLLLILFCISLYCIYSLLYCVYAHISQQHMRLSGQ